jgi:hypothetical protein
VPSRASPGAGVSGLRPRLHRGAAGRAQGPDHLHTAVAALLGTPDVSPASSTARAARSASEGSVFSRLRRELRRRRSGRSTSSTSIPLALRWRASLRPRSCWCLLTRRTSRGQNPPPSFEEPLVTLHGLAGTLDSPRRLPRRWSTATATWKSRCVSTPTITATSVFGLSAPIVVTCAQLLSTSRSLQPEEQEERTDDTVRGHVTSELLYEVTTLLRPRAAAG